MCSIELGKRRRVCNGLWGTIFPTDSIHIEASEVLEMYQHIIDTKSDMIEGSRHKHEPWCIVGSKMSTTFFVSERRQTDRIAELR